ncbi:hypothetical protein Aeqsu_0010 [Aequorivita sublithincola DSM 14238]|uniref:Uncharacterized protein n=1 Tax=Aequorivita sublithincola (strain DSM 14238 / LMG 21431 / ACAM 643 / 9-3) TaxID=746697 RepID=I3YRC4_AEQSU|nr:DUF6660 family protein [Aequorivita sublithincola]AFL79542.1 hypothetical protein Aeqsu_0010 [Aequorivita sublithincola DSM 14238]
MKILAIILSVYFLALNFVPCNDIEPASGDSQIEKIADYNNDHNHETADLCSPFCHCQCCQVPTIDNNTIVFEPLTQTVSKEPFTHFESFWEEIPNAFTQPPRV